MEMLVISKWKHNSCCCCFNSFQWLIESLYIWMSASSNHTPATMPRTLPPDAGPWNRLPVASIVAAASLGLYLLTYFDFLLHDSALNRKCDSSRRRPPFCCRVVRTDSLLFCNLKSICAHGNEMNSLLHFFFWGGLSWRFFFLHETIHFRLLPFSTFGAIRDDSNGARAAYVTKRGRFFLVSSFVAFASFAGGLMLIDWGEQGGCLKSTPLPVCLITERRLTRRDLSFFFASPRLLARHLRRTGS